jgi:hypothetical protein
MVFWTVIWYNRVGGQDVSQEHATSIFMVDPEDGGTMLLRNAGIQL